jgi:hypothetical protein
LESYKQKIAKTLAPAIKDVYDEIININNKNNMKHTIKLNESDIMNAIKNAVKKTIKEAYTTNDVADMLGDNDGYDEPTNDGPNWDEQVYYKALGIMKKFGFGDSVSTDAIEHVMYDYLDGAYKSDKIMEMSPDEAGFEIAKDAMRRVDAEYYEEEIEPMLNENRKIRLSESEVKNIIKNCVKRVLKENYEPTQADWDDFGFWASSDEPDLVNDEIGAEHDRNEMLLDADDEGSGSSVEYMKGVKYAKNLIAKSRIPDDLVEKLASKEDNGTITQFELGILDTLNDF